MASTPVAAPCFSGLRRVDEKNDNKLIPGTAHEGFRGAEEHIKSVVDFLSY